VAFSRYRPHRDDDSDNIFCRSTVQQIARVPSGVLYFRSKGSNSRASPCDWVPLSIYRRRKRPRSADLDLGSRMKERIQPQCVSSLRNSASGMRCAVGSLHPLHPASRVPRFAGCPLARPPKRNARRRKPGEGGLAKHSRASLNDNNPFSSSSDEVEVRCVRVEFFQCDTREREHVRCIIGNDNVRAILLRVRHHLAEA